MKHANIYPVSFEDFLKIKTAGNYILTYAILDDRIHLELSVENAVFVTQRFYTSLFAELQAKGENYSGSKLKIFLDGHFNQITAYKFYPTDKEIEYIKSIKLYSKLVIKKAVSTNLDASLVTTEYDDHIITTNEGEEVLIIEKVI